MQLSRDLNCSPKIEPFFLNFVFPEGKDIYVSCMNNMLPWDLSAGKFSPLIASFGESVQAWELKAGVWDTAVTITFHSLSIEPPQEQRWGLCFQPVESDWRLPEPTADFSWIPQTNSQTPFFFLLLSYICVYLLKSSQPSAAQLSHSHHSTQMGSEKQNLWLYHSLYSQMDNVVCPTLLACLTMRVSLILSTGATAAILLMGPLAFVSLVSLVLQTSYCFSPLWFSQA